MKKLNILKSALVVALVSLGSVYNAQAQDAAPVVEAPKTTFAGSADMYYKFDFANPKQENSDIGLTSFTDSHNSFQLGMATITASHKMGKASVFADLGFGARAAEFSYNDKTNATFLIKQLNFTYEFTDEFKATAGSFTTHLGYELLDAIANKNYSMSYAFTNGPFFNTGIKFNYTNKSGFGAMAGVTNPTDFKTAFEAGSNHKTYVAQVSYVKDSGSAYLNFTTGSRNPAANTNNTQIDFVGSKKITDALNLALNFTYATVSPDEAGDSANWFSGVLYAAYTINPSLTLAFRGEYFDDKKSVSTSFTDPNTLTSIFSPLGKDGGSVVSNTLSLNYKHGNFTFIPEIRFDSASEKIFLDSKAEGTKTNAYLLFGTTYSF
jgi:hypothetical protein